MRTRTPILLINTALCRQSVLWPCFQFFLSDASQMPSATLIIGRTLSAKTSPFDTQKNIVLILGVSVPWLILKE